MVAFLMLVTLMRLLQMRWISRCKLFGLINHHTELRNGLLLFPRQLQRFSRRLLWELSRKVMISFFKLLSIRETVFWIPKSLLFPARSLIRLVVQWCFFATNLFHRFLRNSDHRAIFPTFSIFRSPEPRWLLALDRFNREWPRPSP